MAITSTDVQAIIDTARDAEPFITTAQMLVDEELASTTLSDTRKDQIVLYLAAHFLCLAEESGGLKRSKLGEGDDSFHTPGEKDTGLAFTRYGQQAMILDTSGTLAKMSANKGLKATFEVVGVNPVSEDWC